MMRLMRRGLTAWGATLVLAVAGTQAAHAIGYRIVAPDHGRREQLLSASGHGYLSYAPLALALGFAILAALLALEARAALSRSASRPCAWVFLLVAPVVFTVQEHLERLVHDGTLPLTATLEPAFQVGLVLQVPFALASYALARALLSAARTLGRLLGSPRRPRRQLAPVLSVPRGDARVPRVAALALGYGERGPPHLA
jgi:hypothetical protein